MSYSNFDPAEIPNPRSLAGEQTDPEPWADPEAAAAALADLEPMRALVGSPDWETLTVLLREWEAVALAQIVESTDPTKVLRYQERIRLLRELMALPDAIAVEVASLMEAAATE